MRNGFSLYPVMVNSSPLDLSKYKYDSMGKHIKVLFGICFESNGGLVDSCLMHLSLV